MDESEAAAKIELLFNTLKTWAMADNENLDIYSDLIHEADEGRRHEAVVDIVVGRLGFTPEDAAIVLATMKDSRARASRLLEEVLGPDSPQQHATDDDCPF